MLVSLVGVQNFYLLSIRDSIRHKVTVDQEGNSNGNVIGHKDDRISVLRDNKVHLRLKKVENGKVGSRGFIYNDH